MLQKLYEAMRILRLKMSESREDFDYNVKRFRQSNQVSPFEMARQKLRAAG